MRYHGRALLSEWENLLILILADSINLESLNYAARTIETFANSHPDGFYILLDLEKNVLLPIDCTEQILKNQQTYLHMGMKGYYLCYHSELQKNLFSRVYIDPLKREDAYVVSGDIEQIFQHLGNRDGVNIAPAHKLYQHMKTQMASHPTTTYDLLPHE